MKKTLMMAAILAAFLAFLALPSSQASAAKPIKWSATASGENLIGPVNFVGGVDHADITSGTGTCTNGSTNSFLQMRIYDPSSLNFIMPASDFLYSGYDTTPGAPAPCGFKTVDCSWPNCVAEFLNGRDQPTPDYGWVCVRFITYGCANYNLMTMKVTDPPVPVHMSIEFWSHVFDCPNNSPWASNPVHNLIMNAHGWYHKGVTFDPDIYIRRISEKEWMASVDTEFDNPNPNIYGDIIYKDFIPTSSDWTFSDNILGQYATCSGKGKNTVMKYWYPWAKAPLKFQIKFTKN